MVNQCHNEIQADGTDSTDLQLQHSAADRTQLLPIVISQRERLSKRLTEMEEEAGHHQQQLVMLNAEVDKVRSDNVKLYEKIRFLQSYQSRAPKQTVTVEEDDVSKYSSDYEHSLDPFRRFNQQERQRKYQQLRTHDKVTIGLSRIIMSNGTARIVLCCYLLFMHCLIFVVLYKLAFTESCKRDFATDCSAKFQEHMHSVHGVNDFHG